MGKFSEALDAIFANQDSLVNSEWPWFFAGLRPKETAEVRQCLADAAAPPLIQAGRDMGTRIGVRGTPAVLLQGWRYPGMPSDSEMTRAIRDLLAGKQPYKGFPRGAVPSRQ